MPSIYTVGQVNAYIKSMFTQDFLLRSLQVEGEISNLKYHSSGHIYFTLKDSSGSLSCVCFRSDARRLNLRLADGMKIIAAGGVDVYERDGRYQLYVRNVKAAGAGGLFEKYEKLKKKLAEQGMFAAEYKQEIPKYVRVLGVVTAPTGAAVRDIINVSRRRNPYIKILLYPAIVQGDQAADSIVKGIETLAAYHPDVIIAGRGGGSIEDLWAFNEEKVAEAIFNCKVPIISAVGHETDTTIADYVADLRAPTPSAAAELAVFSYDTFEEDLRRRKEILTSRMAMALSSARSRMQDRVRTLTALSPTSKIREMRLRSDALYDQLTGRMRERLSEKRNAFSIRIEQMKALSPLSKLNQGYAYVSLEDGKGLKKVGQVQAGDALRIHVTDGMIEAVTQKIIREEAYGGKEKG